MVKGSKINIVIVGAGKAGRLISDDILERGDESPFHILGFVDDDEKKIGTKIKDVPVMGLIAELPRIVKDYAVEELFIAIPSGRGKVIRSIIDTTAGMNLAYKILPRQSEILLQDFKVDYLQHIRRVKPEDLLGGEILKSDQDDIADHMKGQVVLVTGAAGSIGSELSRQVAAYGAKKVVLYDWWENGVFELRNQLVSAHPDGDFEFIIGDVKDKNKLDQIMRIYQPTTVFHAAAYKHVPLMEGNPSEAIRNNILGTKTVGELAIKNGVRKFILVSTDKAVNPTNIMGATKRAAEKTIHLLGQSQEKTIFCAVRFGNVINSNGSAIPFFLKQIEEGGPVTVTHKEMTRFFMTIPEAVHLILQAWVMGENNDLFVLDMGESVKIYDLARTLIALEGYVPEEEIKIEIIGLRPGEKLYEEVLVKEEETSSTPVEKIFRTKNYLNFDKQAFIQTFDQLLEGIDEGMIDIEEIKPQMKKLISTYKPKS